MASPLPGNESKIRLKSLRRGFNRVRDVILPLPHPHALPETSTANITDDDRSHSILSTPHPSQHSSGTDSADKVGETGVEGNRSQDTIPPRSRPSHQQIALPETNTSHKTKGLGCDKERARDSAPVSGKEPRCVSSSQVSCRRISRLSGSGISSLRES